jgi:hypothetical protein
MSYLLSGTTIRGPYSIEESNSTQVAQQRTLSGAVGRDYFGSNKRIWTLEYKNTNPTAYTTIKTIYNTYLSTGTAVTWQSTETNYTIASTTVHIDLQIRQFSVRGSSYISDFTLILTEV